MDEMSHRYKILAASVLLLSACAGPSKPFLGATAGLTLTDASALPTPFISDYSAAAEPFMVGPYDVLDISVFGNEDLRVEQVQVDASGRINFPLVGAVDVAGKTPRQVAESIELSLRGRFIKNPQATVNLRETASQVVAISGEVKRPGIYPIVGEMTLLKVIAKAEGWTEFSKKGEVVVLRTVGGKKYAALYNVDSIEKGNYPDPRLYANDTVVVGDSQAKRNLKNLYTIAPALLAPLIFLLDSN